MEVESSLIGGIQLVGFTGHVHSEIEWFGVKLVSRLLALFAEIVPVSRLLELHLLGLNSSPTQGICSDIENCNDKKYTL